MSIGEWITAAAAFALAGTLLFLGILHALGRGPLLNNAWLWASEEERKTLDKRPYRRQSAAVFCLLGGVFAVIGLSVVLRNGTVLYLEIPFLAAAVVTAVVTSARINRR